MIRGAPPSGKVTGELFGKRAQFAEAILQKGDSAVIGKFVMEPFCRMIAKIGHAHVMAAMANAGTLPKHEDLFLPSIILGESPNFQHYVGGENEPLDDDAKALHQLRFSRLIFGDRKILVSTVRLFACFGMPRYHVIACYEPR